MPQRPHRRSTGEVSGDGRQVDRGHRVLRLAPTLPQQAGVPQRECEVPADADQRQPPRRNERVRQHRQHHQQRRHAQQGRRAALHRVFELRGRMRRCAQRLHHIDEQQRQPHQGGKQQDHFADPGRHTPQPVREPPGLPKPGQAKHHAKEGSGKGSCTHHRLRRKTRRPRL